MDNGRELQRIIYNNCGGEETRKARKVFIKSLFVVLCGGFQYNLAKQLHEVLTLPERLFNIVSQRQQPLVERLICKRGE